MEPEVLELQEGGTLAAFRDGPTVVVTYSNPNGISTGFTMLPTEWEWLFEVAGK